MSSPQHPHPPLPPDQGEACAELDLLSLKIDNAHANGSQPSSSPLRHLTFFREPPDSRRSSLHAVPSDLVPTYGKICELYEQLQGQMNLLGSRVGSVIEKEEQTLVAAFKQQIIKMQEQIEEFQTKLSRERKREQQWAQENDSPKNSQKLSALCDRQREKILRMSQVIENLQSENQFLSVQVKKTRRECRDLREALGSASVKDNRSKSVLDHSQPEAECLHCSGDIPVPGRSSETIVRSVETVDQFFANLLPRTKDPAAEKLLSQCRQFAASTERRHEKAVSSLQHQLAAERRNVRRLRAVQASMVGSRTDLEQLFYECVEAVRRQIVQRGLKSRNTVTSESAENNASALTCSIPGEEHGSPEVKLKDAQKVKIMESFMTNDRLLQSLYSIIFKKSDGSEKLAMASLIPHSPSRAEGKSKTSSSSRNVAAESASPSLRARRAQFRREPESEQRSMVMAPSPASIRLQCGIAGRAKCISQRRHYNVGPKGRSKPV